MEKINHWSLNRTGVNYDSEEVSVLNLVGKLTHKTNEVVDKVNEVEGKTKDKITRDNLKNEYQLTPVKGQTKANFEGSWQGLNKPTLSQEGAFAQVEKNMNDIKTLKEICHVSEYGAIGDGTDETEKIQNAINSNAKTIVFDGSKIYTTRKLTIPSNKIIDGNGCTLKAKVNGYEPVLVNANYTFGTNKDITIQNINIDGLKLAHTPTEQKEDNTGLNYYMNGIFLQGVDGVKIYNCKVYNTWGICIYTKECKNLIIDKCETYGSERHSGIVVMNKEYFNHSKILNCYCHDNNLDGIEYFQNTDLINNICANNGICKYSDDLPSAGIYGGDGFQDNCKLINNTCYGNSGIGIEINKCKNQLVEGNICYNNGLSGIIAQDTTNSVIKGNICYNNHKTTNPQYINDGNNSGIMIGTWSGTLFESRMVVMGNVCYDNQATKTQTYGIQAINCDYNTIVGNLYWGQETGLYKNANTNSVIMDKLTDLVTQKTSLIVKDVTIVEGSLNLNSASAMYIPKTGTPSKGCLKYDETTNKFMGHNGTSWVELG